MLTKSISYEIGGFFLIYSLFFIGINLLFGLSEVVDNAAHIGGLLSGFICGLILYPIILIEKKNKKLPPKTEPNQPE
jgi:membrane associated rhomboid family serine protease